MLRALAPAKVNLCLFLGATRGDGRHELVTLFESVSLSDQVSMSSAAGPRDEVVCPGVEGKNLALAALEALRERGWAAPPVRVEIVKRIPIAAGMAGGSADAAAVLRTAMELAPGRPEEVAEIAASLGADVPSQLAPGLVLGTGAGEIVEPVLPLAPHAVVVVPQRGPLSTANVYGHADLLALPRDAGELAGLLGEVRAALIPGQRLQADLLINDLEPAAVSLCPEISDALEATWAVGADEAFVCGSGPTAVGVFWGGDAAERAGAAAAGLATRFPGATAAVPVAAEYGAPRLSD